MSTITTDGHAVCLVSFSQSLTHYTTIAAKLVSVVSVGVVSVIVVGVVSVGVVSMIVIHHVVSLCEELSY